MDHIKCIMERAHIQQLSNFLLNGVEDTKIYNESYQERLKSECNPIFNRLESIYSNKNELDLAIEDLSQAFTAYEEIYMEIGIKAGARLMNELLYTNDNYKPDNLNF